MSAIADNSPLLPEAISWSEGMLLSPQHFQQNDIYWSAMLHHQMSVLQPYGWGVLDLAISSTELIKGRVVFERLRCVMNDGLLIDYPGHFLPQELSLDLSKHDWTVEPRVLVQLRVPIRGKGAASNIGDMQRYSTERGNLEADENTGKDEIPIDRLRPKMSLVAGSSVAKCYCAFPLLELRGDSRGVHLTDYHPPMLRLDASGFQGDASLQRMLKDLSEALWKKYRELLGIRADERGEPRYDNGANAQIIAARHLVMGLPRFDVLLQSGITHPYQLYVVLSELVGFVAATPGAPQPPAMKAYEHNQCMPQFQLAIDYVRDQLDRLNADYTILDFEQVGASGFRCPLPQGIATDTLLIELTPRAGQDGAKLGRWLDAAHIATEELIYVLVRRRFPGARVKPAGPGTVAALNLRPGSYVYEISNGTIDVTADNPRELIAQARTLVILGEPDENVPAAITLYLPRHPARAMRTGTE